jgi:hypothetical protein
MEKLAEALIKLFSSFDKNPWRTLTLTVVVGVMVIIGLYIYVHQPKSVPEGSQIIQSTGDGNKNSNSK